MPFEIVTVRGEPSGTLPCARAREISAKMRARGHASRRRDRTRGGTYEPGGDYSFSLFERINLNGNPPARALFDMAAVAIVKNPAWATARRIPAPTLEASGWVDRPGNARTVIVWENFDTAAIMRDFYASMERFDLVR